MLAIATGTLRRVHFVDLGDFLSTEQRSLAAVQIPGVEQRRFSTMELEGLAIEGQL